MQRVGRIAELREVLAEARSGGARIGLVPTMGYLHEGHLTLVDAARAACDVVVLSIFVNPLQFGAGEDLERYPRDLERDAELAAARGVDLLFAPEADEMYPRGAAITRIAAPGIADRLCGAFRPGHFDGVLTVVAKLFNIVMPDTAVFGQKDLQQSVLIRRMVQDLDFPIRIEIAPIAREADGLAMSSRNAYLTPAERQAALALHRSLQAARQAFRTGASDPAEVTGTARAILTGASGVRVQYVEAVELQRLGTPDRLREGDAVAVAAFAGATRLIDNVLLD
jgi:pantoate--beta-alanine ligase